MEGDSRSDNREVHVQNAAEMWVDGVLSAIEIGSYPKKTSIEYNTAELHSALIAGRFSVIPNSIELRAITRRNPNQILVVVGTSQKGGTYAMATALRAVEVSHSMFNACMVFEGPNIAEDTGSTIEFDGGETTAQVKVKTGEIIRS